MALDSKKEYNDFAVLYRTNAQSRIMEETLIKTNIPYRMVGGHKFYDRKEIKDILAYLTLIANPSDNFRFNRVVNVPKRGIGASSLEKLILAAEEMGWSLYEAALNAQVTNLSGRAANSLEVFAAMINDFTKWPNFLL